MPQVIRKKVHEMTSSIRKTLARGIAAAILLVSSIGVVAAHAASSPAILTYTSSADHYSIGYFSTWSIHKNVATKDIGKAEQGISSHAMQVATADHVGVVGVLVAAHATSDAKLHSTAQSLITENSTFVGKLSWGTATINGVTFIQVTGIEKAGATLQGSVSILGASHGSHTYYLLKGLLLKQKTTSATSGQLYGIINSFRVM
jgi:hypothetical protein